jgi:hypothetical protein
MPLDAPMRHRKVLGGVVSGLISEYPEQPNEHETPGRWQ